ncbi:hypothetical protein [Porphyrobacter sp. AAP60]|uniref:hypothetical protein n=1 Tax=Porphyrobacter sp. AAP60 TaxID=1523423 RepID=UPI0006B8F1AD|nr:hypothetical protein [Porphyrobacter sp. AAP60]KPF62439.1 hypothetical protein IP79_12680 [Porphyrobacter sp. AAP60]
MNQSNFRVAATAATFALLAPCAAQAQQTADVDALASLEPAEGSLTVRGAGDLQFGLVTIPNNSRAIGNVVCAYDLMINPDDFLTARAIRESPDFDASPIFGVSPSGCEFRSVPEVAGAGFEIICAPSVVTNFQISWNASTADPALNFVPPSSGLAGLFIGGTSTVLPDAPGGSASSGSVACPAGGAIDVLVGGTLRVQQTAIAAANASVGSVSLSVNY